jgi:hypothetical protein
MILRLSLAAYCEDEVTEESFNAIRTYNHRFNKVIDIFDVTKATGSPRELRTNYRQFS